MPVFMMNVPCRVFKREGSDVFGQPVYANPGKEKCAVVKMQTTRQHSTVRADSSGTRGHADELLADVVVLMSIKSRIAENDKLELPYVTVRVSGITVRYDVMGRPDHLQVEGTIE